MARTRRLDAPGQINHVWIRGIEGQAIFLDPEDCADFVQRLAVVLPDAGASVFAWAFVTNHAHFLVRSGPVAISQVMRRINTGYARCFNQRHDRFGYLFQSRFGSRAATTDSDVRNLLRYVHLNPVGAGLASVETLADYRWCGHGGLMGVRPPLPFESAGRALALFDAEHRMARKRMFRFLVDGRPTGEPPALSAPPRTESVPTEEVDQGAAILAALEVASALSGLATDDIRGPSRRRAAVRARTLCVAALMTSGIPLRVIGGQLGVSEATVGRMRARARAEVEAMGLHPRDVQRRLLATMREMKVKSPSP